MTHKTPPQQVQQLPPLTRSAASRSFALQARTWLQLIWGVQAVALLGVTLWYGLWILTHGSVDHLAAWVSAGLLAACGVLCAALAWAVRQGAGWFTGPGVALQMFVVVASWPVLMSNLLAVKALGVGMLAWAGVSLYLLLTTAGPARGTARPPTMNTDEAPPGG